MEQLQHVTTKWAEFTALDIENGWYDIITFKGSEHHAVYAENDSFHFSTKYPSILKKDVQWVRKHSKS